MAVFTLILFVLYGLYLFLGLLVILGLKKPGGNDHAGEPFVSIVVAARNEEETLPHCLLSLI